MMLSRNKQGKSDKVWRNWRERAGLGASGRDLERVFLETTFGELQVSHKHQHRHHVVENETFDSRINAC